MVDPSVRSSTLSGVADAQSTTTTTNKPVGLADTDWLYLYWEGWINSATMPTATWPAGFVERYSAASATDQFQKHKVARKKITAAGGEPATYTVTINNSHWHQCQAVAIRDADQTEPEDGSWVGANNSTGTGHPSASKTTSAKCLMLWFECNENSSTPASATPPTGYTEVQDANYLRIASKLQAAAGVETTSGGALSASTQKMVALMGIKGAAASGASGTITGTNAAVTGSLTGNGKAAGTMAGSIAGATGSLSGVSSARGTLAGAIASSIGSLSAQAVAQSSLTAAISALTGAMSGRVVDGAILGGAVAPLIGDLAGNLHTSGEVALSTAPVSGSLTGGSPNGGILSGNISPLSADVLAGAVDRGSLISELAPATAALNGQTEVGQAVLVGDMAAVVLGLSATARAQALSEGSMSPATADLAGLGHNNVVIAGSISGLLADLTGIVQTDHPVGQLVGMTPSPGLVLSGRSVGAGGLEGTLAGPSLTLAGAVPAQGGLAGLVANLTANIQASSFENGGMPVFGTIAAVLPSFTASFRQAVPTLTLVFGLESSNLSFTVEDNLKTWLEGDRDAYSVQ